MRMREGTGTILMLDHELPFLHTYSYDDCLQHRFLFLFYIIQLFLSNERGLAVLDLRAVPITGIM